MAICFAQTLLRWFDRHGRHDLPWQHNKTPYRVWVSEIMLQQTQVDTVIPYYQRFLARFPTLAQLAKADIDEVLHLWTGLGYYARARNLHKCAIAVCAQHGGNFPNNTETLRMLPGIGPSTAAAIASLAFDQPEAILDGNVKRVLARYGAIEGWPGNKSVETQLWRKARELMPSTRCADYTQAIMDLGATLCTRTKPDCKRCPMARHCLATRSGNPEQFPHKKPTKTKPVKHGQMLLIYNSDNEVALFRRPESGIWGGLWSLPELGLEESALDYVETQFGKIAKQRTLPAIKHVFSHYTLMITPHEFWLATPSPIIMEEHVPLWYNPLSPPELGLAAPVKKLILRATP